MSKKDRQEYLLKKLSQWENYNNSEDQELREKLENDFHSFVMEMWPWCGSTEPFVDGWHLRSICEHLEELYYRRIKNILIHLPPRTGKSSIISVLFPAWVWCKNPREKFLCASYSQELQVRDSTYCRRLIQSPVYARLWGFKVALTDDVNSKLRFENKLGGGRKATSVGGTTTGEGGDFRILDDPNNARDVDSETMRESVNDWYDKAWSTRITNPNTSCQIITQQRLHERDLSGHILAKENIKDWVNLVLPMEFELSKRCSTIFVKSSTGKIWRDPRIKEGELLWPQRMDSKFVKWLKGELGSQYAISGQLQQAPSPSIGGIIKKEYFRRYEDKKTPENIEFILQSWDTALVGEKDRKKNVNNAYSVCTTWGVFKDHYKVPNVILLSLFRGRIEMPELYEMAQRLSKNYLDTNLEEPLGYEGPKPNMILVEAKANGLSLIQMLYRAGISVSRFDPNRHGSKIARARLMTPMLEGGRIWVPAQPPHYNKLRPYADILVEACALFPNAESNDIVDSMSQAIIKLTENNMIIHPDDPIYYPTYKNYEKKPFY